MNDQRTLRKLIGGPLLLGSLGAALGLSAVGCDTIAEISFDERRYDKVRASGIAKVAACQEDDSRVELRFVLLDQENKVIREGDRLLSDRAEAPDFTSNNISLGQGKLYPVTPKSLLTCSKPCDSDGDCDPVQNETCSDSGFCLRSAETDPAEACLAAGFDLCRPYDGGVDNLDGFEGTPSVSFCRDSCTDDGDCAGDATCVADDNGSYCSVVSTSDFEGCSSNNECPSGFECLPLETAVVGAEAGLSVCTRDTPLTVAPGSLRFLSPPADGVNEAPRAIALVMDNSGSLSGRGVTEDDGTVKLARATDPNQVRLSAAKSFLLTLGNQSFQENTVVSVWSYTGESELGVTPLTGDSFAQPPKPYISNFDAARRQLDSLGVDSRFGRSNVFLALQTVAQNTIDQCQGNPRCEKLSDLRDTSIILFTDGPDDSVIMTAGADAAERDLALQRWNQQFEDARTTLTNAGARVYIIHLDSAIGGDGFEATSPDPRNPRPYLRDADGRTGPIEEYSQLACATGGQYLYMTNPFAMNFFFNLMSDLNGGTWAVDMAVEALDSVATNGAYRFSAEVGVNLDGRTESFFLDPFGNQTGLAQIETDDTRSVVFKREGLDPETPGNGGNGGGDGGDGGGDSGE